LVKRSRCCSPLQFNGAATAEISRTQVWQWLKKQVNLEDGRKFNMELYKELLEDEVSKISTEVGENIEKASLN
jgi:malate synthase